VSTTTVDTIASRALLGIAIASALPACAVELGDPELDELYAGGGFHEPNPLTWTRVFKDPFDGGTLSSGWVNQKGPATTECYSVAGGRLTLFPRNRDVCQFFYNGQTFGPTGRYFFAAKVKLPRTRGHFASFWVRGVGGVYNELDVIETFGDGIDNPDRKCGGDGMYSSSGTGWYGIQNVFYSDDDPKTGRKHCFGRQQMSSLRPFNGDFHVFSLDWEPGRHAIFAMDGVPTAEFGDGAAIAGNMQVLFTNFLGEKVASGDKEIEGEGSQNLVVEWVKVWKKDPPDASAKTPVRDLERDDRAVFDAAFYLALYPDLQAAFGGDLEAARQHWLTYGILEGRVGSPTFDLGHYRSLHAELQPVDNLTAIDQFLESGLQQGGASSPFFDADWYLAGYSDLSAAFGTDHHAAAQHFLAYGISEGRSGAPTFDAAWYLAANPDVAAAYGATNYLGAMVHWQVYGRSEGRPGVP
jgi:hypothetical protein